MSARMETEPVSWNQTERGNRESKEKALSEIEVEDFMRGVESEKRGAPLRDLCGSETDSEHRARQLDERSAQEQWHSRFARCEQMRTEIKRGRELLQQVQTELETLRSRLDEWTGYETVCGKNPLSDYMQTIAAKERIEQYLPVWLKRREEELHSLNREIERGAHQGGG
ncbi:MAG TPA: hypothetical protein VFA77_14065 [Candidatus Eisenbacteria bacterium]|nr:hypothetical protein [Candidatus Eisenbacteria bacterium]